MKKILQKTLISILLLGLIGCNAFTTEGNNQKNEKQGQNVVNTGERDFQPIRTAQPGADQKNASNKQNERSGESQWNNQGLSKEYHGHIDHRPNKKQKEEKKANPQYKQVQLLGINDLHGQLNVTRQVNGKPVGRADFLAAYIKQRAADNKNTLLVHAGDMVGASPPVSCIITG